MTQTFVYKGKEVFLTGRTATKTLPRGGVKVLHEIKPKKYMNDTTNNDITTDWVVMADLYEIVPDEKNQTDE